jgi:hypothetical protein
MSGMVKFFVTRVKSGAKKWTDVPSLWKDGVIAELKAEGYILNDDGTVAKEVLNG